MLGNNRYFVYNNNRDRLASITHKLTVDHGGPSRSGHTLSECQSYKCAQHVYRNNINSKKKKKNYYYYNSPFPNSPDNNSFYNFVQTHSLTHARTLNALTHKRTNGRTNARACHGYCIILDTRTAYNVTTILPSSGV